MYDLKYLRKVSTDIKYLCAFLEWFICWPTGSNIHKTRSCTNIIIILTKHPPVLLLLFYNIYKTLSCTLIIILFTDYPLVL